MRGLTWADSGQHKNKNDYYHSSKTRLRGQLRKKPMSWVRRANPG